MDQGWIKLHRSLLKWEWFRDANTFRLFTYLLLSAVYKPTQYKGKLLEPGQLVTRQPDLAKTLRLTPRQIRVALDKLKMTGEVSVQVTNQYSIITINRWVDYQDEMTDKKAIRCQSTRHSDDRQDSGEVIPKQVSKSHKKERSKEIKRSVKEKKLFGEFVLLTDEEYDSLLKPEYFGSKALLERGIKKLDNYIGSSGKKYKSHWHVLKGWVLDDLERYKPIIVDEGHFDGLGARID
jgi:hypothetical protein